MTDNTRTLQGRASLQEDIRSRRGIFNSSTPEEIIGYMDKGNLAAAGEYLCREALIHESCGNQYAANAFYELAERL